MLIATICVCLWPGAAPFATEVKSKSTTDQPQTYNRLIHETSPYLQQHATNPIDWFPWANEASEKLLVRSKEIYDGALPSGNSAAAFNLLRLAHMTGKTDYIAKSETIIKAFSDQIKGFPAGHAQLMVALEFACQLPTTSIEQMLKNLRQAGVSQIDK